MDDVQIKNLYPLTPMQEGMLFHSLLDQDHPAYHQQMTLTLKGAIHLSYMEQSMNHLIAKYDVLRTVFLVENVEQPLQVVLQQRNLTLITENIAALPKEEQQAFILRYEEKDRLEGFDLTRDLLIRVSVLLTGTDECVMIWSFHHIIMDGWCMGIILDDFFKCYEALVEGRPVREEVVYPYSDYMEWLLQQDQDRARAYWQKRLAGYEQQAVVPAMRQDLTDRTYRGDVHDHLLPESLTKRLEHLAREEGVTLSTVMQALWGILLQKYNYSDDVVYGTVVSGRPASLPGVERMVGLFINTIPVRVQSTSKQSFHELLQSIQEQSLTSNQSSFFPLAEIQADSVLRNSLIQHLVVFENYPIDEEMDSKYPQLGFEIMSVRVFEQTSYDFNLMVVPGKRLKLSFNYNKAVYDDGFIAAVGGHMERLAEAVVSNPAQTIQTIEMITTAEAEKLASFNHTSHDYPLHKSYMELFAESVALYGERQALVFDNSALTYYELHRKVNQLAVQLRKRGVNRESIVGIMVDPSLEMIVSVLAVLKAGGAFLPIDPGYPLDKVQYFLEDSGAAILLTQSHFINTIPSHVTSINLEDEQLYSGADNETVLPIVNIPHDLAYVIYTSGSTGLPKGVMIEHSALVNLCFWHNNEYKVTPEDRTAKYAGFSFDCSVWEIFPYLICGASIHVLHKDIRLDVGRLNAYFEANRITITYLPTQFAEQFMKVPNGSLRILLTAGDKLKQYVPQTYELVNNYGPTENAVITTYYYVDRQQENIPIGIPVHNHRVYVLDKGGKKVPIGVPGELCVSGSGLARGYWNKPELTAEKFVVNPYEPGEQMYRTGDLVAWLPDGNIQYFGRMDQQVKIRGHRIEIGEIETQLMQLSEVQDCVVVATRDDSDQVYLCAYIVGQLEGVSSDMQGIRQQLVDRLPDYMVPAVFMELERIPVNVNGKIDRKALPKPVANLLTHYEEPLGEWEVRIAELWSKVLGLSKIGRQDHFFDIGGHSLKAVILVTEMQQAFDIPIHIRDIFTTPTIKELGELLTERERKKSGLKFECISSSTVRPYYPLSSAQRRMYVLSQLEGVGASYQLPGALLLEGTFVSERLERAIQQLLERHEALRTRFALVDGEPMQQILSSVSFQLSVHDFSYASNMTGEETSRLIQSYMESTFIRPFNLGSAPLMRMELLKVDDNRHVLLYDMHHLITDGTSITLFVRDFMQLYNGDTLAPLQLHYKDYAVWQHDQLASGAYDEDGAYWLHTFAAGIPVLQLPTDLTRPAIRRFAGGRTWFMVDKEVTDRLEKLAANTGSTLYMVLLTAYHLLLAGHSGQREIVIGTPVSGRTHADMHQMLGMFVNTLPIITVSHTDQTIRELLLQIKELVLASLEHQDYPFEELLHRLNVERDTARNPLFDTMFALQNMDEEDLKINGVEVTPLQIKADVAKCDLTLIGTQTPTGLVFELEYSTDLFQADTMERWAAHFQNLLRLIATYPDTALSDVDIIPAEERKLLIHDFNATAYKVEDKLLHELFEEQAARIPNAPALIDNSQQLTFGELNNQANRLARLLRSQGVVPGEIIGVSTDRTANVVIAILAIMKSGAAYLPLDPGYPAERLRYFAEDSRIRMIVSNHDDASTLLPSTECHIIDMREHHTINSFEGSNLSSVNRSSDLAYVIYTSGSTGRPKGVMIEHRSISATLQWRQGLYAFTNRDMALAIYPYAFDGFVIGCLSPLFGGATVVVLDEREVRDPLRIKEKLISHQVTHFMCIPSLYAGILDTSEPKDLASLRIVALGGERLTTAVAKAHYHSCPNVKLVNEYGPTENSVTSTHLVLTGNENEITIGRPNGNMQAFILDESQHLLPIGVPGELCVSGVGLARGYLNRNDLTSEKFINHPFRAGERLYRTGDMARFRSDGSIEYLGRIDHQVKIRGYRIELGEVEEALLACPGIQEAVVIDRKGDDGTAYLCAYIVAEGHKGTVSLNISDLQNGLLKSLPHYMVPTRFVQLDNIPLSPSGKADRQALPAPSEHSNNSDLFMAPEGEQELLLAELWTEVLGVERIGRDDNFFQLGGDSIKAIQVSSRLYKAGYAMEMKELFQQPVLKRFATTLSKVVKRAEQGPVTGEVPLTPIQRWFFEQQFTDAHHFNQSILLFRSERFEPAQLYTVMMKLTQHHDALRSVFHMSTDKREPIQIIQDLIGETFGFEVIDVRSESNPKLRMEQIIERAQSSFHLSAGPLVKMVLLKAGEGDHLLFTAHHLIVDGVSWRILLEDFNQLYRQILADEPLALQEKTFSYKEWSNALAQYARTSQLQCETAYWQEITGITEKLHPEFQQEQPASVNLYRTAKNLTIALREEDTSKLLRQSPRAYNTEVNELLLAALSLAMRDWIGAQKVLVTLEGHGREKIQDGLNISRTVGWFTSTFPVQLDLSECSTIADTIQITKENIRKIPERGIGYGVLRYLSDVSDIAFDQADTKSYQHAYPSISFNYLGQFDQEIQSELFELSDLSVGPLISPNMERMADLEFIGMVMDGQLTFSLTYNGLHDEEGTASRLIGLFMHQLEQIIDHCNQISHTIQTPSDFGCYDISLQQWADIQRVGAARGGEIIDLYPLAPMQEGMLFHALKDADSLAYVEQLSLQLSGQLNVQTLKRTVASLFEHHDVLRTMFLYEGLNRPYQAVLSCIEPNIHEIDLMNHSIQEQDAILERLKQDDLASRFDLQHDALVRLTVIKLAEDRWSMLWTHHHILMDGWCIGLLFEDLFSCYEAYLNGIEPEWVERQPYRFYLNWLKGQDQQEAVTYWKNRLAGYEQPVTLPKSSRGRRNGYEQENVSFTMERSLTSELNKLAKVNDVTLNTVVQTVWASVLQRYNDTEDVVFGTVVSGRPPEINGIEDMIGLFINTIPVRFRFLGQSFADLLQEAKRSALHAMQYDYLSLADIQAQSPLKHHLFDHILVFENTPVHEAASSLGEQKRLGFTVTNAEMYEQTSYDFDITVGPGEELFVKFSYNACVYDRELVEQLARHFKQLAEQAIAQPDVPIERLELLSAKEKKLLTNDFNARKEPININETVSKMIEQQASLTPDRVAVAYGKEHVTYESINRSSNQLAHYLQASGVGHETLVIVLMDRSPLMIETILAIWKAGGAYIPIDPEYPVSRKLSIMKESRAQYMVTTSAYMADLPVEELTDVTCVRLDVEKFGILAESAHNVEPLHTGESLAYVIYTSGSTGKPKGAMIEHAGMLNHIAAEIEEMSLNEQSVIAQNANHCFDISVWQMFAALTIGGTTAVYANDVILEPSEFLQRIAEDQVTVLEAVPSYLALFMDELSRNPDCKLALQYLMITGETVKPAMVKQWFEICPGVCMVNAYGPAEAADDISHYVMEEAPAHDPIPIGSSIRNMNMYIVDSRFRLMPIGSIGEICVSGIGVGRGYLNDEERTQAVFMEDPFTEEQGVRLYRTGDLGRWLPDGTIAFYGRKDNQVKIRGYRVELGEIEAQLVEHDRVREAVVLDAVDHLGGRYLCAYIVTEVDVSVADLRNHAAGLLPDYMVPALFLFIDEMPLSPNGKIDRKALPQPSELPGSELKWHDSEDVLISDTELNLAKIWSVVLGVEWISREHSFFELGGHSLKAMTLTAQIRNQLSVNVTIRDIFAHPTLKELAELIDGKEVSNAVSIKSIEERVYYPASSAQRRMYIASQMPGAELSYNIPQFTLIEGSFDEGRLQLALKELSRRHEALRTSFTLESGEVVQRIHADAVLHLETYCLTYDSYPLNMDKAIQSIIHSFVRPFDLTMAPLARAGIIRMTEDKSLLMLDIHHIVSDGVTSGLLASEFAALYRGEVLPQLNLQYKDFAVWQQEQLGSENFDKQERYWLEQLKGEIPILQLPTDFIRPVYKSYEGDRLDFAVDEWLTSAIRMRLTESDSTLFMYLLAAFHVLLSRYSGQNDLVIGSPVAGRQYAGLERVCGMFVNTLPLRSRSFETDTFIDLLMRIKELALGAYENQDYPIEELLSKLKLAADPGRSPLFDAVLVIQNLDEPEVELGSVAFRPYSVENKTSKFDVTLLAVEEGGKLSFSLEYCTALFEEETMRQLASDYQHILQIATEDPSVKLNDIRLSEVPIQEERAIVGDIVFEL
ncbi:non-ribosomal peptide synthetase [Paenibacillus assamensis]|uniref:non-ribosomal peptide synthetase n=1 Tax=Paenibacillus assamensis TaxID=311244 RepID=UPI0004098451|nr:non-ribosomal peptide synthetase [Paenibacillus assamensis]